MSKVMASAQNFISILEITSVITTVLQYLSGACLCLDFIKKKSTGDLSGFPFICGFLSSGLWIYYGVLSNERGVVLVNIIGITLFLTYIFIYQIFTANKRIYLKQFLFIILCLLGIILYDNSLEDYEQSQEFMGTVCCIITVCFFGAPLANLLHVIRQKNSESLPFPLIITSFLASTQWLVYGILISDMFIQIPNFLGCILSMLQLSLFVCYPPKSFAGKGYKLVEQTIIKL